MADNLSTVAGSAEGAVVLDRVNVVAAEPLPGRRPAEVVVDSGVESEAREDEGPEAPGSNNSGSDEGATRHVLGEGVPIEVEEDELLVQNTFLTGIRNITPDIGASLKRVIFVSTGLQKLEGLENCTQLEHLELYQNQISRIENLPAHLSKTLKTLDLSFNKIRKMKNLDHLVNLERLLLSNNKIGKIACLDNMKKLRMLELGANRLRNVDGLTGCAETLEELWVGKQKLTTLDPGCLLPKLTLLSAQSNRLENWGERPLAAIAPHLTHVYLGHNALGSDGLVESLGPLRLVDLDLAGNELTEAPEPGEWDGLEELWMNDNSISSLDGAVRMVSRLPGLRSIYLERNPMQTENGPLYRQRLIEACPSLRQLDASSLETRPEFRANATRTGGKDHMPVRGILKNSLGGRVAV